MFEKSDTVWVKFSRPCEFILEGEQEPKISFSAGEKIEAILRGNLETEWIVEIERPQVKGLWWTLSKRKFSLTKRYTQDQPSEFEIFDNGTRDLCLRESWVKDLEADSELHNLPHGCDWKNPSSHFPQIPDSLYDIAGNLLCKIKDKPWGQQGKGNVPFNPDILFTCEFDWAELICALHHLPGTPLKVYEEAWDHFLNVLPPLMMHCHCEIEGKTWGLSYVMGEGTPLTAGFVRGQQHYLISIPANALIWKHDKNKAVTAAELFYSR